MNDMDFEKIRGLIQFNDQGLVPSIIQDAKTLKVLTLCYMNNTALRATLDTGYVHVFRRSQNKLMKKGETSGHTQALKEFRVDCEGKSLLMVIDQKVAACHKGFFSCYFDRVKNDGSKETTDMLIFDPGKVY
jgi:phosphoribosyl-AMP cyclohydrolase